MGEGGSEEKREISQREPVYTFDTLKSSSAMYNFITYNSAFHITESYTSAKLLPLFKSDSLSSSFQ
jgi:hypothetical protein